MSTIRVAGAQIDLTVGDLSGNEARILSAMEWAERAGAEVLVLPTVEGLDALEAPHDLVQRLIERQDGVRRARLDEAWQPPPGRGHGDADGVGGHGIEPLVADDERTQAVHLGCRQQGVDRLDPPTETRLPSPPHLAAHQPRTETELVDVGRLPTEVGEKGTRTIEFTA